MGKKNPLGYVEWRTKDPERLGKFFAAAFKWKLKIDESGYGVLDFGDKQMHAGVQKLEGGDNRPVGVSNYITVKNLEATEERIREAGGRISVSKQEVPGIGHFSFFSDPDGNLFAIWQALGKKERKRAQKAAKAAKREAKAARKEAEKTERRAKKDAEKSERRAKKEAKAAREQASQPS
jgi:predicted enzyme related to lactoylglutathione lyase